ncbi:hypothetical protein LJY25_01570 [Hymenobacter sp. BT175]|uniref:hypothetical protein n=1 Tax=Hymenobacter translucens TaxID=2886507 RepID=UPI001D0ECDA9|nr:hypothetical protein [Hymenobacter translucens]MCC2545120.1 hypothetical protein [Hymenobacter translucens]
MQRNLLLIFLLLLPGLVLAQKMKRPKLSARKLSCTIRPITNQYRANEPVILRIKIQNMADSAITLVNAPEGADLSQRYPHATFYVSKVAGSSEEIRKAPPKTGSITRIGPGDFIRLAPGESFDPLAKAASFPASLPLTFPVLPAGVYDISFQYSTLADDLPDWLSNVDWYDDLAGTIMVSRRKEYDAIVPLLSRVPRVVLSSNTVRVTVVP